VDGADLGQSGAAGDVGGSRRKRTKGQCVRRRILCRLRRRPPGLKRINPFPVRLRGSQDRRGAEGPRAQPRVLQIDSFEVSAPEMGSGARARAADGRWDRRPSARTSGTALLAPRCPGRCQFAPVWAGDSPWRRITVPSSARSGGPSAAAARI